MGLLTNDSWDALSESLVRARERGFLGPGEVGPHIDRALAFAECLDPPASFVDIGTGAGLPGLVLAFCWPSAQALLLDGSDRRIAALREEIELLGLDDRVTAMATRLEEAGRTSLRGSSPLVVARAFGKPAVTAECGAPLLAPGGVLAIAEPPTGSAERWPADKLSSLGLSPTRLYRGAATIQLLELSGEVPARFPRRTGIPSKRPLW